MKKFLLLLLVILPVIALAQESGPSVAKDPGTSQSVGTAGEVAIPGPNKGRQSWSVCCHANNTAACRFSKSKTVTSTTGVVLAAGVCYSEPIGSEKAYTGPVAVAASAGTVTYFTLEN